MIQEHITLIDLSQEITDYLSPRLNDKENTKWSPQSDVIKYLEMSSDEHEIVCIKLDVPSRVAEENLKHLAIEINNIDKKYRIKGFLLKAAALELLDNSYVLVSYMALSPSDAIKFKELDKYK